VLLPVVEVPEEAAPIDALSQDEGRLNKQFRMSAIRSVEPIDVDEFELPARSNQRKELGSAAASAIPD
jgi:hypothetical protein